MRIRLLACLAAAALAVAAAQAAEAKTTGTQQDLKVAATACAGLRSAVGALTFGHEYANVGACAAQWVATVPAARTQATWACRVRGLGSGCVAARTQAGMQRRLLRSAAALLHCTAQLNLLGASRFVARYGGATVHDAFVTCAAPKSIAATSGPAAQPVTYTLTFTLAPVGGSSASGDGFLQVRAGGFDLSAALHGADPGQEHGVLLLGQGAACPTPAQVDNGGVVVLPDDSLLVMLNTAHQSGVPLSVPLAETFAGSLAGRTIVLLGETTSAGYDNAYPIACGTIAAAA